MFKKGELKILWPFYLSSFLFGVSAVIIPFTVIYFRDLGLSFFEISLMMGIAGLSAFLFEMPTGAFADSFSRKCSVLLGVVIAGFVSIAVAFVSSYYSLLVLWVLLGVAQTFVSGADEAWVIDNLNKLKRKDLHQEYLIKDRSMMAIGAVVAPLLGTAIVAVLPMKYLWVFFGSGFFINAVLLLFFANELYLPKKVSIIKSVSKSFKIAGRGFKFIKKNKALFFLFLGGLLASLISIADVGWQPLFLELSLPKEGLGVVYSVLGGLLIVAPYVSKIFKNLKPKHSLSLIVGTRAILLFMLLFVQSPLYLFAVLLFLLDTVLFVGKGPLVSMYVHKIVPSNIRATVISANSMLVMGAGGALGIAAGALIDVLGPQKMIAFMSVFGVLAIIAYQRIKD